MGYDTEKDLSDREYQILQSELREYEKSHLVAYLLWFFLGTMGVHKFYIGKSLMGLLYIALGITAFIGLIATFNNPENVGWWVFPGGVLGLLLIYDLFSIPSQIKSVRRKKKQKILRKVKGS